MKTELSQKAKWTEIGKYSVTSELFIDLIFNSACNCNCPFCIARTETFSGEDTEKWKVSLQRAFDLFDIKSVIILGGEATVDPLFWDKLDYLSSVMKAPQHIILTTNGIRLRDRDFLKRLTDSCITSVNLSYMHYEKEVNDAIFAADTLTKQEITQICNALRCNGKTLRLNANVYRGNLDSCSELRRFTEYFSGCCDYIKFSPLMDTEMFGTVKSVLTYSKKVAIPEPEIRKLYDEFSKQNTVVAQASNILGFVDYSELSVTGQGVILKYAQVEDKYDTVRVIPTLKLYPNGNLSNTWEYQKNILEDFPLSDDT